MAIPGAELSETLARVVETVGRSVVRVEGGRRRPTSGVVISPKTVVTALHGLEREDVIVGVEGAELTARVKGRDPSTDLALLELDGTLPVATFSEGAGLKVGNLVLLLARPGETVRAVSGIVMALGNKPWRSMRGAEIDHYLETDAPHQPGFSGGPLVGLDGQVLGLTSTRLLQGVSLTVPTTTVKKVVAQLEQHGRVRASYLGLKMQPVPLPEQVQKVTSEELGLLVIGVESGGPGEAAGIQYGDTILHLGDDSVRTLDDLYGYLRTDHVGQRVPVRLYRTGGVQTLELTLGARPVPSHAEGPGA